MKASSHLKQLGSESIYILREVVANFSNPVMMYSIGKDSSVMLHLAIKAFAPGKIPFKFLHIATMAALHKLKFVVGLSFLAFK
jgi:sulfate adenylyltransferase subunit 2